LGLFSFVHVPKDVAIIILIQAAMPPLTALPIFAGRANANRNLINQFLFSSMIISLITIPLLFVLMPY
ncbi:MAG: AEC family transporter, partial [Bacteriovoracia bacterium]